MLVIPCRSERKNSERPSADHCGLMFFAPVNPPGFAHRPGRRIDDREPQIAGLDLLQPRRETVGAERDQAAVRGPRRIRSANASFVSRFNCDAFRS